MITKLFLLTSLTTAHALLPLPLPLPLYTITQFPSPFWIENIAVRSNGDLLLTTFSSTPNATLYTIPSPSGPSPSAVPLHTFTNFTSLFGITESSTTPDVFILAGGNLPAALTKGEYHLWSVDFRAGRCKPDGKPRIEHLVALPSTVLLPNGLVAVPGRGAVLLADSLAGVAWSISLQTGTVATALNVSETAPPLSSPAGTVGINGVKIHGGYLYWSHSSLATIFRVGIDGEGYPRKEAKVETVAKLNASFVDDFAVGTRENGQEVVWAATNSDNTLVAADVKTGKSVVIAGAVGELTVAGGTADAFGRGKTDKRVLYVVTCGGLRKKVNGTLTEGGKVVAVDTTSFNLERLRIF